MDAYGGEYTARLGDRVAAAGRNTRLVGWGRAAARLFAGDPRYKIGAAYIEFANGVEAGEVSVPSFTKYDDLTYYAELAASADGDYLRVPAILPASFEVASGYEAYFARGEGNQLLLSARTTGVVGVHGKPFSAADQSVVIGFAFVSAPEWEDPTLDVGFGRAYFPADEQIALLGNLTVSLDYRPFFGVA